MSIKIDKWHSFLPLCDGFKRYKCCVQYKGTRFSGWTSNSEKIPSIEYYLQKAFDKFIGVGNHTNLKGSSRTDKGVHAIKNVFQIDLIRRKRHTGEIHDQNLDINKIRDGINYYLYPINDIKITEVEEVDEKFDSRRNATSRTYIYRIICPHDNSYGHNTTMFSNDIAWVLKPGDLLDVAAMQKAANLLIGEHDFSSFRNSGCQSVSPLRFVSQLDISHLQISTSISSSSVSSSATFTSSSLPSSLANHPFLPYPLGISPNPQTDLLLNGSDIITITITANSFLLKMVRNIVGVLVEVGRKQISFVEFEQLFYSKNRSLYSPAVAQGLFLLNVQYDKSNNI